MPNFFAVMRVGKKIDFSRSEPDNVFTVIFPEAQKTIICVNKTSIRESGYDQAERAGIKSPGETFFALFQPVFGNFTVGDINSRPDDLVPAVDLNYFG